MSPTWLMPQRRAMDQNGDLDDAGPTQPTRRRETSSGKEQPELLNTGLKRKLDPAFLQVISDEILFKNRSTLNPNGPGLSRCETRLLIPSRLICQELLRPGFLEGLHE